MNRNLLFVSTILALFSCSQKSAQKDSDQVQIKSVNTVVDPRQQKLQSLKSSMPVDLGDLQNLLPERMNDIKRTHYSVSNSMGYGMAHADYEKNSKTDIRITLYDCSGEAGAGLFESIYLNRLNQTREDATSILKTIDLPAGKALEKFDKETRVTTISYMVNDQVLAIVSGRNIEPAALKESVQKLTLP